MTWLRRIPPSGGDWPSIRAAVRERNSVHEIASLRAAIDARSQRDPESMAAARAILRRIRWIHIDHLSPSFFRFDDDDYELSPPGVTDALGQMIHDHPTDVQIFNRDAPVLIDQFSRLFEMKIASLPSDLQMFLRRQANRLPSPVAPLDSALNSPLSLL